MEKSISEIPTKETKIWFFSKTLQVTEDFSSVIFLFLTTISYEDLSLNFEIFANKNAFASAIYTE